MHRGLLVLTLAFATSPAFAQLPEKALLADKNGDGKVSAAEYQTSRRTAIMRNDTDKDGKVSAAEWKAGAERIAANVDSGDANVLNKYQASSFAMLDADKDGALTPAEIDAWSAARFPKADLNKDGFVDKAEAREAARMAQKK